jgi:hypothetical protein
MDKDDTIIHSLYLFSLSLPICILVWEPASFTKRQRLYALFFCFLHLWQCVSRGRILGQNPYKSFKSFPSCYSQSPLQLCLRFLLLQTHATFYSFRKGERRKTWYKAIPPSLWFKKSIQKPQVWELSRLCPETSTWLSVHEFGLWCESQFVQQINKGDIAVCSLYLFSLTLPMCILVWEPIPVNTETSN